jgi:hypothetical protein
MSDFSSSFVIPLVLDQSVNAVLYGEEVPTLSADYIFNPVTGVISLAQMNATFKYSDTDEAPAPLLKYDVSDAGHITDASWHDLIVGQELGSPTAYRNATVTPTNALFAEHVIQWICSTLFGHPQAQAPLTNDDEIKTRIETGTNPSLGKQLYNKLTEFNADSSNGTVDNLILRSLFEQLVNEGRILDPSDVGLEDTSLNFVPFPFKVGDELNFLIKVSSTISNDVTVNDVSASDPFNGEIISNNNVANLGYIFQNVNGVSVDPSNNVSIDTEIWQFRFIISE